MLLRLNYVNEFLHFTRFGGFEEGILARARAAYIGAAEIWSL